MKRIKFNRLLLVPVLFIVLQSCHKVIIAPVHLTTVDTGLSVKLTTGLYVLNQGSTATAGSLTFYDYNLKKLYPDLFYSVNNTHFATGGSDMEIYGSRLYCTINADTSGLISLNAHTGKLIEKSHIPLGKSLAFYKNNVIFGWSNSLSTSDTARISTDIENSTLVSDFVASMSVLNNKLYVVVEHLRGSYVLVMDLSSFKTITALDVGGIVHSCTVDAFGNLYVPGDFFNNQGAPDVGVITIIDYASDTVKSKLYGKANSGQIYAQGDFVYYPTADNEIAMYNAKTQTAVRDNFITDGTLLASPQAITGNSATGEIFITDVKDGVSNGMLYAFDNTGKLEYSFLTGVNPVRIVLLN